MATILITGCSSGFGKTAVSMLLERGHTVVAALRGGQTRLEQLFSPQLKTHSDKLLALDLHMEKPESFASAARLIEERLGGKLDALINNAGYGLFGSIEDLDDDQLRHQMEVNFFGPALLTRALLPALRAARGRVINVSSIAGRYAFPLYTAYNASKFALEGLTEAMHYELEPHGVQVTLIEPGGFNTEFSTRSLMFGKRSFTPSSPYRTRSEALQHFLSVNSRHLGNPIRVARLIVRSVERRTLPVRQPIGLDARVALVFGWLIPQRLRFWLMSRVLKFVIFRGA